MNIKLGMILTKLTSERNKATTGFKPAAAGNKRRKCCYVSEAAALKFHYVVLNARIT